MTDSVFPWQKLIAEEEARRSPNLITRQRIVPKSMTPGEVDALRREWNKLHSGSANALKKAIITYG